MDGSDPLKHRLNLWLKSEQALGLPSVPRVEFAPRPPAESARAKPTPPASQPRPAAAPRAADPAPQGQRQTDWFGAAKSAPPAARASASTSAALPLLETPITGPILSRDEKLSALAALDRDEVKGCV